MHESNDEGVQDLDDDLSSEAKASSHRWGVRPFRAMAAHPILSVIAAVVVVAGVAGFSYARDLVDPKYQTATYDVPTAPLLKPTGGEVIYRIDPTQSSATYEIDEEIVGKSAATAKGTTSGIAGDIAVNNDDAAASRVGEIVINVEQFHSDSTLRDARIRSDFLQSHQYKLARFTTSEVKGLPHTVVDGKKYPVELTGDLTVKDVTKPVTWKGTAVRDDDRLDVKVDADVKMSEYGVGPISIVGLLSTSDDVKLSLHVVALDPTSNTIPTEIPDPTAPKTSTTKPANTPTFAKYVKPILEQNCASCHVAGTIGADVWKLDTAGDAAANAPGIALVSGNRYMPPWPASDVGVPLEHSRNLTDEQLATLRDWADGGGDLDVPASTPMVPNPVNEPAKPRKDVVMTMPEMYAGDGTEVNDYRCFLLDPKITEPTYVTGVTFEPGQPKIVHHAILSHYPATAAAGYQEMSSTDGRPGWSCGLGGGATRPPGPEGQPKTATAAISSISGAGGFGGWAPGSRPRNYGDDRGFLFQPGDVIVMQIHYHYGSEILGDQSTLSLQTTAPKPGIRTLLPASPIAPVELPCPAGATSPLCDRDAALADMSARYGPFGGVLPNLFQRNCGPDSYTSDPVTGDGTAKCDSKIRKAGHIISVSGHMHELGKTFRMTLNPGTPEETVLLDIPAWNFDWQIGYEPVDPVTVKPGDTIRIECAWDRSQRPDPDPKYISWAEGTEDEMCFSGYTIDPDEPTG